MLHHDEIVLFQVQLFIRHDKEFGGAFALEGFNALPFLILKQSSDGRMGANDVIDPRSTDLGEALARLLPEGADIVVDAVGSQLGSAVGLAAPRARVLLFGLNDHARPEVQQSEITKKELTVVGSFVGQHAFPDAIRLLDSGLLDLTPVITHQVGLDGLVDLLPDLRRGVVIKAVVILD